MKPDMVRGLRSKAKAIGLLGGSGKKLDFILMTRFPIYHDQELER